MGVAAAFARAALPLLPVSDRVQGFGLWVMGFGCRFRVFRRDLGRHDCVCVSVCVASSPRGGDRPDRPRLCTYPHLQARLQMRACAPLRFAVRQQQHIEIAPLLLRQMQRAACIRGPSASLRQYLPPLYARTKLPRRDGCPRMACCWTIPPCARTRVLKWERAARLWQPPAASRCSQHLAPRHVRESRPAPAHGADLRPDTAKRPSTPRQPARTATAGPWRAFAGAAGAGRLRLVCARVPGTADTPRMHTGLDAPGWPHAHSTARGPHAAGLQVSSERVTLLLACASSSALAASHWLPPRYSL